MGIVASNDINTSTWSLLVYTVEDAGNNGEGKVYVDKILRNTPVTMTSAIPNSTIDRVLVGAEDWNNPGCDHSCSDFEGMIDELRIYSRVLSSAEIDSLYKQGKPCPSMTLTINTSNTTSGQSDDGQATVNATGGDGPYEFSLDNSTFQSSNTFSDLAAGNYTVTVKDANGCTKNRPIYYFSGNRHF